MIKFGTSGWRGIIAQDFTFDNVRLATQGIAQYLRAELADKQSAVHGRKPLVVIGYDTRFLGREFSLAVAEVLASNGLEPLLCDRDTPTPVIAHNIRTRKAIGGINMTASHNPAEYQGLKFSNVVKSTVFLTDLANFAGMNEIYAKYFTENFPARSTIQVAGLPKGASVEIEVVAHF